MPIVFATLKQLPQNVQAYLRSVEVTQVNESLFAHYGLDKTEQQRAMLLTVLEVFLGKTSLKQFPSTLAKALGKSVAQTTPLAAEIGMRLFFPARDYLGPVHKEVAKWDAKAATKTYDSTGKHFSIPAFSDTQMTAQIASLCPPSVKNPRTKAAFIELAQQVVKAGRSSFNEQQVMQTLQEKLQLSEDDAHSAALAIKQAFAGTNSMRVAKRDGLVDVSNVTVRRRRKGKSEDEKAIAHDVKKAKRAMRKTLGAGAGAHQPQRTQLLDEILTEINHTIRDVDPESLRSVISSRVGGARDTRALSETLMRAADQGGAALSAELAMAIVEIVEEAMAKYKTADALVQKKKEAAPKKKEAAQATADTTFTKVVGRAKKTQKKSEQRKPDLNPEHEIGATHEDTLRTAPHFEIPGGNAAISGGLQAPKVAAVSGKTAPPSAVADVPVKAPQAPEPTMTDVRPAGQALTGPVQEIEQLRLVDFRRSSPQPEIRMEKILSAIARIGEESYPDKIQAIYAWRRSEPYQLYEKMIVEALQERKSIGEFVKEQVKARKQVLDDDELFQIIAGNQVLESW